MNPQELKQKISEYISKLPKDAQDIFSSMKWLDQVGDTATKYNLTNDQKEILATETSMALLGIVHLDQYEEHLINELGMDKNTVGMIIADLDRSIFAVIRPSLSNAFADNIEKLAKEKYGSIDKLDERFANLDPKVKEAITNSQYQKNLYTIAGKYGLNMADMGTLDEVTTKVMLGAISNENYGAELAKNTNIPKEKLDAMILDVNEMVFKNIRSFLMNNLADKKDTGSNKEITIPIPPYKNTLSTIPNNLPILEDKAANEKAMENSGVEIIQDKAAEKPQEEKVTMKEDSIMVKSGVSVMEEKIPQIESHMLPSEESQKSILYGIENPMSSKNIIDMKLRSSTIQHTDKDIQSVQKDVNTQKPQSSPATPHDPYHEQI